jgi:hypothetical protein
MDQGKDSGCKHIVTGADHSFFFLRLALNHSDLFLDNIDFLLYHRHNDTALSTTCGLSEGRLAV